MGPRSRDRGRYVLVLPLIRKGASFNGAAVSRPRKVRRRHLTNRTFAGLQWGRGLATAEGIEVKAGGPLFNTLQWGRGLATAEGRPSDRATGRTISSFNGAAVSRPRKGHLAARSAMLRGASMGPRSRDRGRTSGEKWWASSDTALQWGRGLATAEGRLSRRKKSPRKRFNGAAVSRPRKAERPSRGRRRAAGFNGAAVSRPRKGVSE